MKKLRVLLPLLWLVLPLFSQDIYDLNHITEIRIEFKESDWAKKLDELKREGHKKRLPATVTVDGKRFEQVGVRYKGNSSYFNVQNAGSKKLPFNLKADFVRKDQTFPGGYKTIKLSNVFRDPSFVREALSYEIARKYMPAPQCNFAKVWVNNEYLGLYNNTESIDQIFLDKHFGKGKGTLIKCDPEWKTEQMEGCPEGEKASLVYLGDDPGCYAAFYEIKQSKDGQEWEDLIAFIKTLNEDPDQLPDYLNIDMALWMHAFNNVLVNLDSYIGRLSHNYYLYKTPDGLFTPLLWDMNLSFGGFRFDGISPRMLTNDDMQTMSPFVHYKTHNPKRPLLVKLLENPLYRKIYVGHMNTILRENFLNGEYEKRAREIQDFIDEEVKNDPNKLYDYAAFKNNLTQTVSAGKTKIIGLTELMDKRAKYLSAHPLFAIPAPQTGEVTHLLSGEDLAFQASVEGAERVFAFYRFGKKDPYKMVELFNDGAHYDQMADDTFWGNYVPLKKGKKIQYYIVAEGQRLAGCTPERASYEIFEAENPKN
ncbi:MAG: hypothetical protein D6714_11660 [Bacteroidetes bacterium]|nr:MAG: hypothetical protein D6714_11660 [Bacteroidota bacterium]